VQQAERLAAHHGVLDRSGSGKRASGKSTKKAFQVRRPLSDARGKREGIDADSVVNDREGADG
jgi:hypothetical protein